MESIASNAVDRFSDLFEKVKENEKTMVEGRDAALLFQTMGWIVRTEPVKPGRKPKEK